MTSWTACWTLRIASKTHLSSGKRARTHTPICACSLVVMTLYLFYSGWLWISLKQMFHSWRQNWTRYKYYYYYYHYYHYYFTTTNAVIKTVRDAWRQGTSTSTTNSGSTICTRLLILHILALILLDSTNTVANTITILVVISQIIVVLQILLIQLYTH